MAAASVVAALTDRAGFEAASELPHHTLSRPHSDVVGRLHDAGFPRGTRSLPGILLTTSSQKRDPIPTPIPTPPPVRPTHPLGPIYLDASLMRLILSWRRAPNQRLPRRRRAAPLRRRIRASGRARSRNAVCARIAGEPSRPAPARLFASAVTAATSTRWTFARRRGGVLRPAGSGGVDRETVLRRVLRAWRGP